MLADEIEESLLARRRLEVDLRSVHGRTMGLHRSILACAISGQLVPQNPDDDPVSVLLERIRDQRASLPRAGRARAQAVSR